MSCTRQVPPPPRNHCHVRNIYDAGATTAYHGALLAGRSGQAALAEPGHHAPYQRLSAHHPPAHCLQVAHNFVLLPLAPRATCGLSGADVHIDVHHGLNKDLLQIQRLSKDHKILITCGHFSLPHLIGLRASTLINRGNT